MGMTEIDTTQLNKHTGIQLGDANAPITLIEFVNLRCPFCKQWWDEKKDLIQQHVATGSVKHIIKLFNKEKPGLDLGNVMHRYVPNNDHALEVITAIYNTQDEWGNLEQFEDVATFAEKTLGLTEQQEHDALQAIVTEANRANVVFVPTVIVGEAFFDQKITDKELEALLIQ